MRSADNLCLPFAIYLCPKTFKPFMMYNLSGVQCQQICCVHISTTLLHLIHPAAGPGTMFSRALSSIRFSSSPAPLPKKRLHTNTFADGRYHHLLASMSKTIVAYSSKTVQCGVSTSKITRTKPWIGCCDLIAIQQCRVKISKVNSSMSTFS